MKNVYSKLQEARKRLQEVELKKSGKNKFSNYDYFELSDFLPTINKLFAEIGLCSAISFTNDEAVLKIFNSENPSEVIEFTSPSASVELKGCHPIQNLGAVQSYLRRYLFITAMEITENDIIDENTGNEKVMDKPKPVAKPKKTNDNKISVISIAQVNRLYSLAKGKDTAVIKELLKVYGFESAKDITINLYNEICSAIEQL